MGRPRLAVPSTEKTISIPSDIVARVDLHLYSELETRVPHGAWSKLITGMLREFLKTLPEGE